MKRRKFLQLLLTGFAASFFYRCSDGEKEPEPTPPPGPGEFEITPSEGMTLYGRVADTDGNGIKDVVVTDGYSVVITDKDGVYQMVRNFYAIYVYISTPRGYDIPRQNGYGSYAGFYESANSVSGTSKTVHRVDFKLAKSTKDDSNFVIYGVGDPQPDNDEHVEFFRNETIADMKETAKEYADRQQVALGLGDIIGKNEDRTRFAKMKSIMGSSGIPWFVAIGNHDKSEGGGDHGELFRSNFGPLYYSFNIGQAHFICLDNIIFGKAGDTSNFQLGITDEQYDWLEKDLAYVSKDRLLVVYYHIPFRNNTNEATYRNTAKVLELFRPYPNKILMSGHTHHYRDYHNTVYGFHEHILGAACGYFWNSKIEHDGVPNGYAVYEISGNQIKNMRFKGTKRERDYQIRLYRGDAQFSGLTGRSYGYHFGADHIVANVFFANVGGKTWTVEVHEDGEYSGTMSLINPDYYDKYILGYHASVLRKSEDNASTNCYHQYQYQLKNRNAKVEVIAKDGYGNVYRQSKFTENNDYSEAISYT